MDDFKTTYTSNDDILNDFFRKGFRKYNNADFVTGYFSTNILLELVEDIYDACAIRNGIFRLVIGLEESNYTEIEKLKELSLPHEIGEYIFNALFSNISEENFQKYKKIRELILEEKFQIKLGKCKNNTGIFHNKEYIFHDGLTGVAAQGSLNFTIGGVKYNHEKITRRETQETFLESKNDFDDLWDNDIFDVDVLELKDVLTELIDDKIKLYDRNTHEKPELREYQIDAIDSIINNNYCGILEMATGTGKTFTACGLIDKILENKVTNTFFIVAPYIHLVDQWEEEIKEFFGQKVTIQRCHSQVKNWESSVKELLLWNSEDFVVYIFVDDSFFNFNNHKLKKYDVCFICDEMHNLSEKNILELGDNFRYKIGLSATPEDEFDDKRTGVVFNYFNGVVYKYTLEEAIENKFLTPYYYRAKIVNLTSYEIIEYQKITKKIEDLDPKSRAYNFLKSNLEKEQSDIMNQSQKKKEEFLKDIAKDKNIRHTLVYCYPGKYRKNQDKSYLDQVSEDVYLANSSIRHQKITSLEKGIERSKIVNSFENNEINVIFAIKCLDEGFNIPAIEKAYILYSTRRNREYIQRRGRLLRKVDGKKYAVIYDYLVAIDGIVLETENKRYVEYSRLAIKEEYNDEI